MNESGRRAICLVSGGLDSATSLAIARDEGYQCYCLSFDYGQRHKIEVEAARRFYDSAEYRPLLALREQAARAQLALVEGV